jgi:trehalose synthase
MFVTDAPFSFAGLEEYRGLAPSLTLDRIHDAGRQLEGARVLHVNATPVGGGVAEMLLSVVPLMRDAGLHVDWFALHGSHEFFEVTKAYHNALQGRHTPWSREDFDLYRRVNEDNARRLRSVAADYDIVVVHDPQPLVLAEMLADTGPCWVWRCHIDLTSPSEPVWRRLLPHLDSYDLLIFSIPEYVPQELDASRVVTALPCIDPFRSKNAPLAPGEVLDVQRQYGIDASRPYMIQVSRFDPWKDPVGVVQAYRLVHEQHPELQLVYMAAMAQDDPEGWECYEEAKRVAGEDPDVHLLALDVPARQVEENARHVNALQRGASVVVQKSIREGFGLVVAEALWKEKAVVAGDVGGIRYQIRDGWNGYLVDSVESCAAAVSELLEDARLAQRFGRRGRETVTEQFLFTRLIDQYLGWFQELLGGGSRQAA